MTYKLINNDSIKWMSITKDNSIDAIITDPPYGLTYLDREFDTMENTPAAGGNRKGLKGGGMRWEANQNRDLSKFLTPFFKEGYRILKPGSFCTVFSQGRLLLGVLSALEQAGFEIREQFYWRKPTALPNQQSPNRKNSKITINTNRVILGPGKVVEPFVVAQKPRAGTFANNWKEWGTGLVDPKEAINTVWECSSASKKEKAGLTHVTIKPLSLMQRIVRVFSKENDLVVDPFSGSGTTGVACILENRNYVGIEISPAFYEESLVRLNDTQKNKE
jgi:site-specific DNA-methyltransferase (adenine-specific)